MRFLKWFEKHRDNISIDKKTQRDVQKIFASPPVRDYLIAMMDEMVRQGIYLSEKEQIGVKHTIETIKKEIEQGDIILSQEDKRKQRG